MEAAEAETVTLKNESTKSVLAVTRTMKAAQKEEKKADKATKFLEHKNESALDPMTAMVSEVEPSVIKTTSVDPVTKTASVSLSKDNSLVMKSVETASLGFAAKLGSIIFKAAESNTETLQTAMVQKTAIHTVELGAGEQYEYLASNDAQKTVEVQASAENTAPIVIKDSTGKVESTLEPGQTALGVGGNIFMDLSFEVHTIDRTKSLYCAGAGSCKINPSNVEIRVYNRDDAAFKAAWTSNPSGTLYDEVYEAGSIGLISRCLTSSSGTCRAGWSTNVQNTLVIAKFVDGTKTVYAGLPAGPGGSEGNIPNKNLMVIRVVTEKGEVSYKAGNKTVISGSQLEVISPSYVLWENETEYYPFLFSSQEDWEVNVCLYVPEGYEIIEGECNQILVPGKTVDAIFTVKEVGSPEPDLNLKLTATHNDKTTVVEQTIPGLRKETKLAQAAARNVTPADVTALEEETTGEEPNLISAPTEEEPSVIAPAPTTEVKKASWFQRLICWLFNVWCPAE
jgi:hypothetical protein